MIGRLLQAADFKRLMAAPPSFRSAHFAVHHLLEGPVQPRFARKERSSPELSTDRQEICPQPVERSGESPERETPDKEGGRWIGCVVPKRHARRAVTRNLIRRQIYTAAGRAREGLSEGMWLVRLRQPFAPSQYPSAASDALRVAVRQELDKLFSKACQRASAKAETRPECTGSLSIGQPEHISGPEASAP